MEQLFYEDGVHELTNEQYHGSMGFSRSALMKFKQSPLHYWHQYLNPDFMRPEPTPDMILGSLVHTLTLEPELFSLEYALKPKLTALPPVLKLKDVGREQFDKNKVEREAISVANEMEMEEFNLNSKDKRIVSAEMMKQAKEMVASIRNDEAAVGLLDGAQVERSIYWTCDRTKLKFKSRPDAILGGVVIDLKTTRSANPRSFQNDLYKGGYHLQAAMASLALKSIGIEMEKFVFLCCEKSEPYPVAIYILDDEAIDFGINQFNLLADRMAECIASESWPGYGIQTIGLPNWSRFDEE